MVSRFRRCLLPALFVCVSTSVEAGSLVDASNGFAFDVFAGLRSIKGNVVFSPHSLHRLLALLAGGATGATKDELEKVLRLRGVPAFDEKLSRELAETAANNKVAFETANHLWLPSKTILEPQFQQSAKEGWGVLLEPISFDKPANAVRKVNEAVQVDSHGRVARLVPEGAFRTDSAMVLVNAMFFKGLWDHPFPKAGTKPRPFFSNLTRQERNVPMMQQTSLMSYAVIDGVEAVSLATAGDGPCHFAMTVLLPVKKDGLLDLEAKLSPAFLERIGDAIATCEVTLMIPRFSFSAGGGYTGVLQQVGLTRCFDRQIADFTKIARAPKLHLSAVFHETTVEVGEQGVDAAAASAAIPDPFGPRPEGSKGDAVRRVVFSADHSFIFLIQHFPSKLILFLGRYDGG